ncbi:hypothetical protein LTR95_015310, partial [Oleoguttula sp. CCFEE 5521]
VCKHESASEIDIVQHTRESHDTSIEDSAAALIARMSFHRLPLKLECCPFCRYEPVEAEVSQRLASICEHVGQDHQKGFALMSIPWDFGDDASVAGGSSATEHDVKSVATRSSYGSEAETDAKMPSKVASGPLVDLTTESLRAVTSLSDLGQPSASLIESWTEDIATSHSVIGAYPEPAPPEAVDGDATSGSPTAIDRELTLRSEDASKAFSLPASPTSESSQPGSPRPFLSLPGYVQDSQRLPSSTSKRYKCPYCSTDFTRHHNLKSHLLTHSQEKPYACQKCDARFRRLHDLKRHTKLHTGERSSEPEEGDEKVSSCANPGSADDPLASALTEDESEVYQQANHIAHPQELDSLAKSLFPSDLVIRPDQLHAEGSFHEMTPEELEATLSDWHLANGRRECPYCSEEFVEQEDLKSHVSVHHGREEPYICPICNARFRRLHDLKRHTKLHTDEMPHVCDKCGRRFARGDALARHTQSSEGCFGGQLSRGKVDDLPRDYKLDQDVIMDYALNQNRSGLKPTPSPYRGRPRAPSPERRVDVRRFVPAGTKLVDETPTPSRNLMSERLAERLAAAQSAHMLELGPNAVREQSPFKPGSLLAPSQNRWVHNGIGTAGREPEMQWSQQVRHIEHRSGFGAPQGMPLDSAEAEKLQSDGVPLLENMSDYRFGLSPAVIATMQPAWPEAPFAETGMERHASREMARHGGEDYFGRWEEAQGPDDDLEDELAEALAEGYSEADSEVSEEA